MMALFPSSITLGLLASVARAVCGAQGTTLKNDVLEVVLSSTTGAITSLTDLRPSPGVVHTLAPPPDGSDWAVVLSDYNATTNVVTVTPSVCKAPVANTTALPSYAAFTFDCTKWLVAVEYSLPAGASSATKGIRFGAAKGE